MDMGKNLNPDYAIESMTLIKRYGKPLFWVTLSGLIINVISIIYPLYSSFVYDKVFYNGITATLVAVSFGVFISEIINFAIKTIRSIFLEDFARDVEQKIDHSVITTLLGSRERSTSSVGEFIERYKQLLGSREVFTSIYLSILIDLPFTLLFMIALSFVAGSLVMVPIFTGLLLIVVQLVIAIPSRIYDRQAKNGSVRRFNILTDILGGRDSLVCSSSAGWMSERWEESSAMVSYNASRSRFWNMLSGSAFGSINTLSMMLMLIGGAYLIENQAITSGGLFAATILNGRIMGVINSVVQMSIRFREFIISKRQLDGLLQQGQTMVTDTCPGETELLGPLAVMRLSCVLKSGERMVLKNINVTIQQGERVAIVGSPGAGKTTLLRVLAGRLMPTEGEILLAGFPLLRIKPERLSQAIAYKAQDAFLFDGTIEDNIRAGDMTSPLNLNDPWLVPSGLTDAIASGELNLATQVGPRGTWLSGGQRQMVALARSLFNAKTSLVVLDEPTTGFDAAMETRFAERLAELPRTKTFIMATHCHALLSKTDRILVVKDGQIVAQGSPSQFLS